MNITGHHQSQFLTFSESLTPGVQSDCWQEMSESPQQLVQLTGEVESRSTGTTSHQLSEADSQLGGTGMPNSEECRSRDAGNSTQLKRRCESKMWTSTCQSLKIRPQLRTRSFTTAEAVASSPTKPRTFWLGTTFSSTAEATWCLWTSQSVTSLSRITCWLA